MRPPPGGLTVDRRADARVAESAQDVSLCGFEYRVDVARAGQPAWRIAQDAIPPATIAFDRFHHLEERDLGGRASLPVSTGTADRSFDDPRRDEVAHHLRQEP